MVMAILNIIRQFLTGIVMSVAFVIYPLCEVGGGGHYDYEDFGGDEPEFYGEKYSSGTNCSDSRLHSWAPHVADKFLWVYLAIGIMVMLSLCLA